MAAINSNALSKFVGLLYVAPYATPASLTRIASVRGLVSNFDNTTNSVDILADDTGSVFKGFTPEARIEGSFLENVDRDLMKLLLGGTSSNVAGSLVSGATQTITGPFTPNSFYKIENQNGDGSAPTINSVTGGTDSALTADDDYHLVVNDNGEYGIVLNTVAGGGTITTLSQDVVIDYDYTPNAREDLTFSIDFQESPRLYVKIVATDDDSNTRTIIMDDASFEGTYGIEFLDVVEAGDLAGTSFVFKANKGSNYTIQNGIL